MYIKLTHQMLSYQIMSPQYSEELYIFLDLVTNFIFNALQEEEKQFLMQEQSIDRIRRVTCHYLLCQAEHLFFVSLQLCHLSLHPLHLELLLCVCQSQYFYALHIFKNNLGCLFRSSLHFIPKLSYGGFLGLNFVIKENSRPSNKFSIGSVEVET